MPDRRADQPTTPPHLLPAGMLPADLDWAAVDGLCRRYALGVPEIDRQHRMLFGWYVALRAAPSARQAAEGFIAYASGHFASEEAWAAGRGVDIAQHRRRHAVLLKRLDDLVRMPSRANTLALAYEWLTTHIDIEDRALIARVGAGPSPAS